MRHSVRITEPGDRGRQGYRIQEEDVPTFVRIHIENGYGKIEIEPVEEVEED